MEKIRNVGLSCRLRNVWSVVVAREAIASIITASRQPRSSLLTAYVFTLQQLLQRYIDVAPVRPPTPDNNR
jgi:hypothetical protein